MAYVQAQYLITRIREVLEDSRGALRTVPSGRFLGNWPDGLSDPTQLRRLLVKPRVRVVIDSFERSPQSPPINGNLIIYDVGVSVRVARIATRQKAMDDDDMDSVQASCAEDTDVIRQALEYPRNLTTTEDGHATDLISGLLSFNGPSQTTVVGQIDQGAQRIETINRFVGRLIARPAVS